MKKSAKYTFLHIIGWVMLALMINVSVNHADFRRHAQKLQPSAMNTPGNAEIESIYELIAECVFNDEVPDNEDNDNDSSQKTLDLYKFATTIETGLNEECVIQHSCLYLFKFPSVHLTPSGLPPKSV